MTLIQMDKSKNSEYVKEYYGYNNNVKVKSVLDILNDEQIEFIKMKLNKDGNEMNETLWSIDKMILKLL